jgi:hypothetical protein
MLLTCYSAAGLQITTPKATYLVSYSLIGLHSTTRKCMQSTSGMSFFVSFALQG